MAAGHSDSTLTSSDEYLNDPTAAKPATSSRHSGEFFERRVDVPIEGPVAAPDQSPKHAISNPARIASGFHSASLQRSRSYGDGHGNTAFGKDEETPKTEEGEQDPEKAFEVRWDGEHDPMNPRCMGNGRKWVVVFIVSAGSTCVTCTSSMYTSTYAQITSEFHVSRVVATLGLSLFVMGLGIGPMILAPLSEFYGRRPIYVVSFAFFLIWLIPCAVAKNLGTELVARFIDGIAGSAFLSVAGGTVGDMFTRSELQAPMMIFTASPFIGPPVGPTIAGFINQYTSWYVIFKFRMTPLG